MNFPGEVTVQIEYDIDVWRELVGMIAGPRISDELAQRIDAANDHFWGRKPVIA